MTRVKVPRYDKGGVVCGPVKAEERYSILQVKLHGNTNVLVPTTVEHVHNNDRALSTLLPFVALAFVPLSCRLLGLAPLMPCGWTLCHISKGEFMSIR